MTPTIRLCCGGEGAFTGYALLPLLQYQSFRQIDELALVQLGV